MISGSSGVTPSWELHPFKKILKETLRCSGDIVLFEVVPDGRRFREWRVGG